MVVVVVTAQIAFRGILAGCKSGSFRYNDPTVAGAVGFYSPLITGSWPNVNYWATNPQVLISVASWQTRREYLGDDIRANIFGSTLITLIVPTLMKKKKNAWHHMIVSAEDLFVCTNRFKNKNLIKFPGRLRLERIQKNLSKQCPVLKIYALSNNRNTTHKSAILQLSITVCELLWHFKLPAFRR